MLSADITDALIIVVRYSLYSEDIATFGASDYDQAQAKGFIDLFGLPITVQAIVDAKNKK